jgi:two-component system, chemotaxis family, sensor kinase CheA
VSTDPYKYFRIEARELLDGLGEGLLKLEKDTRDKELVPRLLRLAHTLKGASRVVKLAEVAEQTHALEGALEPYRDGLQPMPADRFAGMLGLLDAIRKGITSIDAPGDGDGALPRAARAEETLETVRVEVGEMNDLLEGVAEATVQVRGLQSEGAALDRAQRAAQLLVDLLGSRRLDESGAAAGIASVAKARGLAEELQRSLGRIQRSVSSGAGQAARELSAVRDAANRLRLLPASSVFAPLGRVCQDAAQSLHKSVSFHTSGGAHRLDAHVLLALRDVLLQLVRNAVAHGIEAPSERVLSGKSSTGRVDVEVERRGARVVFRCRDDGRGIDVDALRRVAVSRGLLSAAEASRLSLDGAVELILRGGLTTTGTVTEVSGRGIGLDAVRETAARLKADVTARSERGRGTTIEIIVPVALSSLPVLKVEMGGTAASIPLESVHRTLRLNDRDVVRSGDHDSIVHDGQAIPFAFLSNALFKQPRTRGSGACSAVVVGSGSAFAALGVDRLLGTESVIVRPIPAEAGAEPIVAGASLDAEGHPELVLDPDRLVAAVRVEATARVDPNVTRRPPLLVVDDSLTTRMLEQSILESAGFEVDLAASAEEALAKAAARRYGVFIVDVEMPGMDGFDFVARTRADPVLRETPAILLTSRSSEEDRQRGRDVGAHAYMVKGEFDQGHLLQLIRGIIG